MSCVAGIAKGGTVWIAADSAATSPDMGQGVYLHGKTFRLDGPDGEMLVGCAGSLRVNQVLRFGLTPPPNADGLDVLGYLCGPFATAVSDALHNAGAEADPDRDNKRTEWRLLIGYSGRLFEMQNDLGVLEALEGYNAVGAGGDLAKAVLYATDEERAEPEARLMLALGAAEKFNASVRGPFTVEQTT